MNETHRVDKRNEFEPMDRVYIQAASTRWMPSYDGVFGKWYYQAQLDTLGSMDDRVSRRGPMALYELYAPTLWLEPMDAQGEGLMSNAKLLPPVHRKPGVPEYWSGKAFRAGAFERDRADFKHLVVCSAQPPTDPTVYGPR